MGMDLLDVFKNSEDLVEFPAGATIFQEGETGKHMYVILKGDVIISLNNKILARSFPGEIVGEMALINSDPRVATVTARTACQMALIDESSFNALLKHVPEFTMHVMAVLANRLQAAYEMIDD
jgi:CRP/FNR family cyclic AMP-dependent transcriptional regulator